MKLTKWITYVALTVCFCWYTKIAFVQNQDIKFSNKSSEVMNASSISWKGHFGGRETEPKSVYCLMTQGEFLAPTSKNHEKLISDWLAKHPEAKAIVVYILTGVIRDHPESKLKSVWVVDGQENLNLYLVRQGSCPAGTMVLNPGDSAQVSQKEYETFATKVWEAEELAKKEKIGIWKRSQE